VEPIGSNEDPGFSFGWSAVVVLQPVISPVGWSWFFFFVADVYSSTESKINNKQSI